VLEKDREGGKGGAEMKTIIEALEEQIPHGKHCNPDTSPWPSMENNCPYHHVGIHCALYEENVGNDKICEINEGIVGEKK